MTGLLGPSRSRTAASPRWAVVRLVVVLGLMAAAFLLAGLGALLVFIIALVLMVVAHELGHFLTAKWSRMKVTEFFVGFGPRLWSVRAGETEYGVKPILVGAYVKIPGMTNLEEVDPGDEARTYRRQPFRHRVLVASAGSIMHFVMAFVLAWIAALSFGVPSASATDVTVGGFVVWAGHHQTAAQRAGLKAGERIVSVDGRAVATPTELGQAIQRSGGRPVRLVVTDHGTRSTVRIRPVAGHKVATKRRGTTTEVLGPGKGHVDWLIGIVTQATPVFVGKNPFGAAAWAGNDVGAVTRATVVGIGHVFSPGGLSALYDQVTNPARASHAASHPTTSQRVVSIVGAARVATQAEQKGVYYFLSILVALNIVLGLMNMLPMLPLDGGHVAVALYERVRTRRGRPYYQADVAKLLPVAYTFMAVLILIVGSAVFLDIAHPLTNPFG